MLNLSKRDLISYHISTNTYSKMKYITCYKLVSSIQSTNLNGRAPWSFNQRSMIPRNYEFVLMFGGLIE